MKALLIGGTGTISRSVSELLINTGWDLFLLNRGNRALPDGASQLIADAGDETAVKKAVGGHTFDVVANFRAYTAEDVERDFRVFSGLTKQYIFISSASAYQKPARNALITESTPLINPYWQYSRDKAASEEALMLRHKNDGFPVTIVRPSHTYDSRSIPLAISGNKGPWQVIKRLLEGKPVLIHGDGSSLWTLTHSSDFAKGFVGLMGNVHAIGHAVHITSDEQLSWNQVYEAVAEALGAKLKPAYAPSVLIAAAGKKYGYDFEGALLGDKAPCALFDNSKIKRLVPGFCCDVRFDAGIRKSVEYFLSNKAVQTEDPDFESFCDRVIGAMDAAARSLA